MDLPFMISGALGSALSFTDCTPKESSNRVGNSVVYYFVSLFFTPSSAQVNPFYVCLLICCPIRKHVSSVEERRAHNP